MDSDPSNGGLKSGQDEKGRFAPGNHLGRNGGRKKGNLEARAQEATKDGKDLIVFWLTVMQDSGEPMPNRLRASEDIATYGFKKPRQDLGIEGELTQSLRIIV